MEKRTDDEILGKNILWSGAEIEAAVNGVWISGCPQGRGATGVCYLADQVIDGDVAFTVDPHKWGKRYIDTSDKISELFASGAALVITDKVGSTPSSKFPILLVKNSRKALDDLGRAARDRFKGKVICITGSVGKSSTKEGLKHVLSQQGPTFGSRENFNHGRGVPLSLAQTPPDFSYGVYEFAVDLPRVTLPKAVLVRPHVAIVTQIQPDHMTYYPTLEAIADQKSLLFDALEPDGVVILNRDDPLFERLLNNAKLRGVKRIMTFGEAADVDVRLIKCELKGDSSSVTAMANGKTIHYVIGAPGRHMVQNSLAVLAGVAAVGADVEQAAQAFVSLKPLPYRTARHRVAIPGGSFEIIDDTFNANAASIRAALEYASLIKPADSDGRRIAVLGELRALGGVSPQVHASLAEPVMEARIDKLFTVGDGMKHLRKMLPPEKLGSHVKTGSELVSELVREIRPDDLVLVTGLRVRTRDDVKDLGHLVDALRAEDAYRQNVRKTINRENSRTIHILSKENQFSVVFAGDTSFGENYQALYKEKGGENLLEEKGYDYPLQKMQKFLRDADLAIANLETPLTGLKASPFANQKDYIHCGDPEKTPQALRRHNIHAVSLANNHTFDYGREGFEQTLEVLEANEIPYFGAGRDSQDAIMPLIAQIFFGERQITIAIIGAFQESKTYRDQYGVYAQGSAGGVNSLDAPVVAAAVQGVRKDYPDAFVILFPHWGNNYQQKANKGQAELAEALMDAGVNLIIGHGAHLMQDITKRNNQWVVYSLGNFMFNSLGRYARMHAPPFSLVAKLMIENRGNTIDLRLYPIVTNNKLTAYQTRFVDVKEFEQACGLVENEYFTEIIKDRDEYGYFLQLPITGMSRNAVWFEDVHDTLVVSDDHKELLMKILWDSFQQKKLCVDALPTHLKTDVLPRIVVISVSDGISPARVVTGAGNGITKALVNAFEPLLPYNTVKWLKLDIVNKVHDLSREPFVWEKSLYGVAGDTRSGAVFIPEQFVTGPPLDEEKHRFIFDTISLFTNGEQYYPLYRGHRIFNKLSCDLLLTAAKQAGHYLEAAVNSEGRFAYIYQPQRDRVPDKYNILRHAGSIYAILELYQVTNEEPLLTAAKRAINFLLRHIHYVDSATVRTSCVVEGGYVKLGGNALAILAFTKYMEVTQDLTLLAPAKDLAAWIQNTQLPPGNFSIHKQLFFKKRAMPFVSEYYPGEAIFALTRLYPFDREAVWLDAAEKGARYLITVRDRDVPEAALTHDHWFLYALNELYLFRPQPLYIDHALKIAAAIMQKQNNQPRYPDWVGSYYDPPRSTPAAVRSEGLCAAFQLARNCGYKEQAEKIRESVYRSVCFQLQTQIQPESALYLKNPSRALGGFRHSFDNFELRIDYSQHNISALLALHKIML